MIDIKQLKQFIRLMKMHDLSELDLRDGQEQVTLKRALDGSVMVPAASPAAAPQPQEAQSPAQPEPAAVEPSSPADDGLVEITSPMVGTFYSASSPDAEAFVRVGSQIDADAVVCVIEAMKVFNEIKAEVSGSIEKVIVGNGEAVEFGQPLFMVKPS